MRNESDLVAVVTSVLQDCRYPVRVWEILAEADHWGVSPVLRRRFADLPAAAYDSLQQILEALGASRNLLGLAEMAGVTDEPDSPR